MDLIFYPMKFQNCKDIFMLFWVRIKKVLKIKEIISHEKIRERSNEYLPSE